MMKKTLSLLALAAIASAAHADVVNGGFSAGLSGWTTAGDASAQSLGGTSSLWLTTDSVGDDSGFGPVSGTSAIAVGGGAGTLEPFVGVAAGALDPNPSSFVYAYEGSAAKQTFTLASAGTLSFNWNLGTNDTSGASDYADTAFAVVDGKLYTLGDITQATAAGVGGDAASTGWNSFSNLVLGAGTHTIAFGVVDVGDTDGLSTLAVSNVGVSAVPEASTFAMMFAGLTLLTAVRRRQRR